MSTEMVMDLAQKVMITAFWVTLPVLAFGMAVGLVVAIFQAATQIQEASLNFVPKLAGMSVAVTLFGPWMLNKLLNFTVMMINSASAVGGG